MLSGTIKTGLLLVLLLALGCAHLTSDFEEPQVRLTSLRMLPTQDLEQQFEIGLKLSNPNASSLNLAGMSYRLKLRDFDILNGVARDIPEIPGYSEVPVTLLASVNLLGGIRLIQSLLSEPDGSIEYLLSMKLDIDSALLPSVRLEEKGAIALTR